MLCNGLEAVEIGSAWTEEQWQRAEAAAMRIDSMRHLKQALGLIPVLLDMPLGPGSVVSVLLALVAYLAAAESVACPVTPTLPFALSPTLLSWLFWLR